MPIMVIKDPLTWMKSMCSHPYAARFKGERRSTCPSPIANDHVMVAWQKAQRYPYESLIHLWRNWSTAYLEMDSPRLIVRCDHSRPRNHCRSCSGPVQPQSRARIRAHSTIHEQPMDKKTKNVTKRKTSTSTSTFHAHAHVDCPMCLEGTRISSSILWARSKLLASVSAR